ncbi:hypothetical protein J6590_035376 [Homalodisca vitripennis]|nr:hypothetical protein J6590_035376 [Homalodisca vitripennis]
MRHKMSLSNPGWKTAGAGLPQPYELDKTSRQQLSCAYPLLVETRKPRSATRDSGTTRFSARFKDWSRKTDKRWDESPPSLPFVDCRRRWCCHIATVRTVVTSHDKVKWSGREELFVACTGPPARENLTLTLTLGSTVLRLIRLALRRCRARLGGRRRGSGP